MTFFSTWLEAPWYMLGTGTISNPVWVTGMIPHIASGGSFPSFGRFLQWRTDEWSAEHTTGTHCASSTAHNSPPCPVYSRGLGLPGFTAPCSQLRETRRLCLGFSLPLAWPGNIYHGASIVLKDVFPNNLSFFFLVVSDGKVNLISVNPSSLE